MTFKLSMKVKEGDLGAVIHWLSNKGVSEIEWEIEGVLLNGPANTGRELLVSLLREGAISQKDAESHFETAGRAPNSVSPILNKLRTEGFIEKVDNKWNLTKKGAKHA